MIIKNHLSPVLAIINALILVLHLALSFKASASDTNQFENKTLSNSSALAPNRVLKIALPDESSVNLIVDGKFQALVNFLKEYWQIWAIDNKQDITFVHLPTGAMADALNQNIIDVAAINIYNPEQDLLYSLPVAKFKQTLFKRINQNTNNGLQIGIHSNTTHTLGHLNPSIEKFYYQDLDVLLSENQQFDMIYSTQPWLLAKNIKAFGLEQEFSASYSDIAPVYLHMMTRKADQYLMQAINQGLRQVNNTQAQLWAEKYSLKDNSAIALSLGQYIANLSEAEQTLMLTQNEILFAINLEGMPPYIINDPNSNITERGYIIDLLNHITARTGIIFKPYFLNDQQTSYDSLINNQTHLLISSSAQSPNNIELNYSTPILKTQYSIISRVDLEPIQSLSKLNFESIALVNGADINNLLTKQWPNAQFQIFDNIGEAITAVSQQKVNLYIGNSLISGYFIKQNAFTNIAMQPLPQFKPDAQLSFATKSEYSTLITLINRALNDIAKSDFEDMYARWSRTVFSPSVADKNSGGVYEITVYILAGTLVICLFIFWVYYRELQVRKIGQRKVEKALAIAEHARADAEKSSQAKATFLARMSHEIRTPMNGVLGMAEALAFTPLNKEQKELLETLNGSARNLLALLNDVLDFSKMDADKLTLESVPVNLHTLSQNIINGISHLPKSDDLSIKLNISDNITHHYFTDPTRLTQVLNNLLSNAIKFTEHGEVELSIELVGSILQKYKQLDTLKIAVRDTGIGIAPEHQGALFTPFIQADDEITRKFGGTGLGLSICQEIIKAMGSKIEITSSAGHGSIFYFNLSFERATQIKPIGERRKQPRAFHDINDQRFSQYRVLVAEDNLVNVKVLTAQLARLNITADVAENGQQAIEMHNKHPYDIIISDCHMPILDGFELAKTLSNFGKNTSPWLIAITADALSGTAEKCLAAGFNDYMAKPTPQEEVNNKLNTAHRFLSKQIQ